MKHADSYKEVKTYTFPGMVARVHVPDLEKGERNERMKVIHNRAAALLREAQK
jgi:hypothetical protein